MKRSHLALQLATLALLWSCGGTSEGTPEAQGSGAGFEKVVQEVVITSGDPVTVADLQIEGMSCEMMCGGSIRKALNGLAGVTGTEIAFHEGEEADHAVVTYDEAQVSDEDLVKAVQALYDGQYKVTAVTITRQVRGTNGGSSTEVDASGGDKVQVYLPGAAVVPSVITLLSRILRA